MAVIKSIRNALIHLAVALAVFAVVDGHMAVSGIISLGRATTALFGSRAGSASASAVEACGYRFASEPFLADGGRAAPARTGQYFASDGTTLWFEGIDYGSQERAVSALRGYATGASQIIETGDRFDPDGHKVGEYAVAVFVRGNERLTQAMWTWGPKFELVEGPSLDHVLDFKAVFTRPREISTYQSGTG
jgi:hypothetical protein